MAQIDKNDVPAANQLKNGHVFPDRTNRPGPRVLFVGNSITLHGYAPHIGWHGVWGMAASSPERDYVHLLKEKILRIRPDAEFCICQVADWERNWKDGAATWELFSEARDFGADLIICRFVENCPRTEFDPALFRKNYLEFVDYLNPKGGKVILSDGFWHHCADPVIRSAAAERGYPFVALGDLGELDEMKAIGLFEHTGVANHPGDAGMAAIAESIFKEVRQIMCPVEKYAWKAIVKDGCLEEYRRRHDEIWPEMIEVLKAAGIRNYTIWNVGNELFGYYECEKGADFAAKVQAESPVVAKWDVYMKDVMVMEMDPVTGAQPRLEKVFELD